MAGGMNRRERGLPLHERVAHPGLPAVDAAPECPARHCWVAGAVDGHGVKRPGLLVEWRQAGSGWQGRVLYSARLGGAWVIVEEWRAADDLTPC